jgi:RHS repeat-associated protein
MWVPEDNGLVIGIPSITGGIADVDTDGDGVADADVVLEALGIEIDERVKLAELYSAGQSLWRVPIAHFTQPWDCNWDIGFPPDATPPPEPPEPPPPPPNPCEGAGSIIECEQQVLRERVPVAGTPFSLNYSSLRVPGRLDRRSLRMDFGSTLPASLQRIDVGVRVAGKTEVFHLAPGPNQTFDYVFDGSDWMGRIVQGRQAAVWDVSFVYLGVYVDTPLFGAVGSDVALTGDASRGEVSMSRSGERQLGIWDARELGLGGWSLDVHHGYQPEAGVLQHGTGREIQALSNQLVVESWPKDDPGTTVPSAPQGDGGPADEARFKRPRDLAVAADGTIYVGDAQPTFGGFFGVANIRRIDSDGIITRFAGLGYETTPGYNGDGLPALSTRFGVITDIEVAPDGSVYVADPDNERIRHIGLDGIVRTVAGTGVEGFAGDGGPATEAQLDNPIGIGLGRSGDLYIADNGNRRVRKVSPDGTITTIGGNGLGGPWAFIPYAATAPAMGTGDKISPRDVAEHPDGSVYVVGASLQVVRRYDLDGTVTTVAGVACTGGTCPKGVENYGVPATQAKLGSPQKIAIAPDGSYYLTDSYRERVIRVSQNIVTLLAQGESLPNWPEKGTQHGDGVPATDIELGRVGGVAVGPDGVYFSAYTLSGSISNPGEREHIYRTKSALPGLGGGTLFVPSKDSDEVYVFDWQGRHMETRIASGQLLYSFGYTSEGLLSTISDASGNQTLIERDANGDPLRIVAPYGQVTDLTMNAAGYLESIADPLTDSVSMGYTTDGLLTSFTDGRGNSSTMTYDAMGRLETDTDATTAMQVLSSTQADQELTTIRQTGEGVLTTYHLAQLEDGTYQRTNTFADGTEAIAEYGIDSSQTSWLPNGTVTTVTNNPDPRFGMQTPLSQQTTILPSGLTRVETTSSITTLADQVDPFSLVSEVTTTNRNGRIWTSTYTSANGRTENVTPEGRWSRSYIDAQGRITRSELPSTLAVDFAYDPDGRLTSITQGTRVTNNTYYNTADAQNGYLATRTDALGNLTAFERDAVGRVLEQIAPDTSVTDFDWDANSNLVGLTPPSKPQHTQTFTGVNLQDGYYPPTLTGIAAPETTFAFNLDRQPTTTWRPDGLSFEQVYNNAGKLDLITTPAGTIDYSYFDLTPCVGCAPGSLSGITHPGGVNLAHTYDGHLITSTTWAGAINGGIQWSYNNDFRPTTETVTTASATSPVAMSYDNDGLMTCASPTSCPGGVGAHLTTYDPALPRAESSVSGAVTDQYTYNAYGELASYEAFADGNPVFSEIVDTTGAPRDELGRIVDRTETNGGATVTYSYEYDSQGRLIEVYEDGSLAQSLAYDDNGNRLSLDTPSGSTTATYDDQDRLLTYGNFTYTYTDNGELLSRTDTSTSDITLYTYDVFGNLTRVDQPDGTVIEYLVDGRNRRVGKLVNGTLVKQWLWKDQLRIAAELDGAGNLVSRFVYGQKPTTPELVIQGSNVYRVISDHLGSVRAVVNIDDPMDVPARLEYEAFGSVSGTGVGFVPQGFAGGLYDADTGLVRFGARDYDPVTGRWVNKDPIRFDAGSNLYVYANGDPVNYVDADGEVAIAIGAAAVAAAGVLIAAGVLGYNIGSLWDDAGVPAPPLFCEDSSEPDCGSVKDYCVREHCADELGSDKDLGGNWGFWRCIDNCMADRGC